MTIVKQWSNPPVLIAGSEASDFMPVGGGGGRSRLSNSESRESISSIPPAYINKLTVQGVFEIRPFSLPYSRLKGMGFREGKRVSVNEVNSNAYHILLKNITPLKWGYQHFIIWQVPLFLLTSLFGTTVSCSFRSKPSYLLRVTQWCIPSESCQASWLQQLTTLRIIMLLMSLCAVSLY